MKTILVLTSLCSFLLNSSFSQNNSKQQLLIKAVDLWAHFDNGDSNSDYYGLFHKPNQYALTTRQEFEVRRIDLQEYLPRPENPDYNRIKRDNLVFVLSGFDSLETNITGWIPDLSLK